VLLNVWRRVLKDGLGIILSRNLRGRFPKWINGYIKGCGGWLNGDIVKLKRPNRNVLVLKAGILVSLIKIKRNLY
jgi:hypothetical protein